MFEKGKRAQRYEKEDAEFNKMLLCLAGAVVVELLILLLKRCFINAMLGAGVMTVLLYFFRIFSVAGAVLAVAGLVWTVLTARKGKPAALPGICTAVAAGLWVLSVLAYYLYDVGMTIAMILPAVAAVLIVVYFLYQRVFFLNAALTAGGLLVLWLYRQYNAEYPGAIRAIFVLGFVLLALALVGSFLLRVGEGKLLGIQLMPADSGYVTTWITCGVTALVMALALALGVAAAYYLLFALVAWLFVQAVFFTVKLM